jgi:hypothetical protein
MNLTLAFDALLPLLQICLIFTTFAWRFRQNLLPLLVASGKTCFLCLSLPFAFWLALAKPSPLVPPLLPLRCSDFYDQKKEYKQ